MAKDPFDSDAHDARPGSYGRQSSREISDAQLADERKHAAEHAKLKVTLSALYERMASTENTLSAATHRLTAGDVLLKQLTDQVTQTSSLISQTKEMIARVEERAAQSVRDSKSASDDAEKAVDAIVSHQKECADRWHKVEHVIERTAQQQAEVAAKLEKQPRQGMHPVLQGVLIAVTSMLASAIVTGALRSYYVSEGKTAASNERAPDDSDTPSTGR